MMVKQVWEVASDPEVDGRGLAGQTVEEALGGRDESVAGSEEVVMGNVGAEPPPEQFLEIQLRGVARQGDEHDLGTLCQPGASTCVPDSRRPPWDRAASLACVARAHAVVWGRRNYRVTRGRAADSDLSRDRSSHCRGDVGGGASTPDCPVRPTCRDARRYEVVTLVGYLKRPDNVSREDFQQWWIEKHVPFVKQIPGLRRYVTHVVQQGFYPLAGPSGKLQVEAEFDGIAELWFDDEAAVVKGWSSPEGVSDLEHYAAHIGATAVALCKPMVQIGGPQEPFPEHIVR